MSSSSRHFLKAGIGAFLLFLLACSDGGGGSEEPSSSSMASSSSDFSEREDVVYGDTILQDTLHLRLLPDTSQAGEPWVFFLGEYPAGTLITVNAATAGLETAQIRIRAEGSLKYLAPALPDSSGKYEQYMTPGSDTAVTEIAVNDFYTLAAGFYMLEVSGIPTQDTALLRLELNVAKARFQVAGQGDTLELSANDTLRGLFLLSAKNSPAVVRFRSPEGYNLNLSTKGSLIDSIWLQDSASGNVLAMSQSVIRQQLLPQVASTWNTTIQPSIPTYADGPYAFFQLILNSLQLGKGEYFAQPDSIIQAGDTLKVIRPRNDAALYDVRHDQYVYLGEFKAGDDIVVKHDIAGFAGYSLVGYDILDTDGDSVAALAGANNYGYRITTDGKYYLHYYRFDSHAVDEALTLTLTTVLQRPGTISSWRLVKDVSGNIVDDNQRTLAIGKTLDLAKTMLLATEPSTASKSANWFILCEDVLDAYQAVLPIASWPLTDGRGKATCAGGLSPMQSLEITGQQAGDMRLVVQSVADPEKLDTIGITVE